MFFLFDIGGTKTRIGISEDVTTLASTFIFPTPKKREDIARAWQDALKKFPVTAFESSIGCVAGVLNPEGNILLHSPMLPDWNHIPLQSVLSEILDSPVSLKNDADLAGVGEAVFGAGRGAEIILYMTVSTGVGGTRIVRGKIDTSAQGFEPGHQLLLCEDGTWQELENLVSGTAIHKRYGTLPQDIEDKAIWNEVTQRLAIGLYNSTLHWSPERIVLGGSVALHKIDIAHLETEFQKIQRIFPMSPQIVLAELGELGALYGGLALAQKQSTQNLERRV